MEEYFYVEKMVAYMNLHMRKTKPGLIESVEN
jgi:hypothetical protein